jgi:hypothetical protein
MGMVFVSLLAVITTQHMFHMIAETFWFSRWVANKNITSLRHTRTTNAHMRTLQTTLSASLSWILFVSVCPIHLFDSTESTDFANAFVTLEVVIAATMELAPARQIRVVNKLVSYAMTKSEVVFWFLAAMLDIKLVREVCVDQRESFKTCSHALPPAVRLIVLLHFQNALPVVVMHINGREMLKPVGNGSWLRDFQLHSFRAAQGSFIRILWVDKSAALANKRSTR